MPLIAGIVVALLWANFAPHPYHDFVHGTLAGIQLEFVVNDIFMALFFGIAAVEITVSLLPGGTMGDFRSAINPLFATAGGVLGPVGVFFLLNALFGSPDLARGWGITTATDIAIAWLVARLVFGDGHPAITFLLLVAICDDALGLIIIAIFYPDPLHALYPPALLLVLAGCLIAFTLRFLKIRTYWPYLLLAGTASWLGLFWAHLHPALALVCIVPFMPHTRPATAPTVDGFTDDSHSAHADFEHQWKLVVDFGLFFFGLVNAGVEFSAIGSITGLIFTSLLVGKTLGIFGFGMLAQLLGFRLTAGMSPHALLLTSMIAGIGLTVALFVAGAAFTDPALQGAAKMGALASILIAPLALIVGRLTSSNPAAQPPGNSKAAVATNSNIPVGRRSADPSIGP